MTDQKCRELIIRDLDDIKTKFDGLGANIFSAASVFVKKDYVFLTLPLRKWQTTSKRKRKKITSSKHRSYWNMVETTMSPTLGRLWYFRKQHRNWKSLPKKLWYLPKIHLKKPVSNISFQQRSPAHRRQNPCNKTTSHKQNYWKPRRFGCRDWRLKTAYCTSKSFMMYHPLKEYMFSVNLKGEMKSLFNKSKRFERQPHTQALFCAPSCPLGKDPGMGWSSASQNLGGFWIGLLGMGW